MRRTARFAAFTLVILVVLAAAAYAYLNQALSATGAPATTVEVKPGTTTTDVARELERRGLVRNADLFRLVLRYTGADRGIREGLYDLNGRQDAFELARALERGGRPRIVKIVVPEGLRLDAIAARFDRGGLGDESAYQAAFRDTALVPYARDAASLEGFLFPATYDFRPETTPAEAARELTRRFQQEVTPARLARLRAEKLSVYQWVTLASIVQSEAGSDAEMPAIAGVFLNRLERGMPLQSDPTVAYGLGKALPDLDRNAGDFKKDTPYNTYTRTGLPPGPISNPGAAALKAVLEPRRDSPGGQPWLYFLHGKNGEFRANTTFDAHLRDNERYR